MGERFGFYTMMAILVLFLMAKFNLTGTEAGALYSIFYGSIYILALVGGYFLIKKPNNQEQIPAPITNIENKPVVAGETTFVDQGKTISFSYPNAFAPLAWTAALQHGE
jgi:hypothetical protein